jgi:hypothetical protein
MDFGLARALHPGRVPADRESAPDSATLDGRSSRATLIGTPDYMAPEQIEGKPATPALDVYALGLIAFEMSTGRRPFSAESALGRAAQRLHQPAPAPSAFVRGLPPAWDRLVGGCLARDPARRSTRQQVAADLEALARLSPTNPLPPRRRLALLGAIGLMAALAGGLVQQVQRRAVGEAGAARVLRYTFENSLQGWMDLRYEHYRAMRTRVRPSAERAVEGDQAMEIRLRTTDQYTTPTIGVYEQFLDRLPPGTVIRYRVWFPRTEALEGVQPFVLYHRGEEIEPRWGSQGIIPVSRLRAGEWNEVEVRVPDDVGPDGVIEVGVEWRTRGAQTETVYLDAVSW